MFIHTFFLYIGGVERVKVAVHPRGQRIFNEKSARALGDKITR